MLNLHNPKFVFLAISTTAFLFFTPVVIFASTYTIPQVKVYNAQNLLIDNTFLAFDEGFKGGGKVTMGDLNRDGVDEIIIGAGTGGGPQVRGFDKNGVFSGLSIFPFHPDFRGGVDVTVGDVDGDKNDEIVVSQWSQGQAWVKIYESNGRVIKAEFLAFDASFKGGANVVACDIDGNGVDEIVVGAGAGGGPHVRIFNGKGEFTGIQFFSFHPDFRGGVDVACGNVDGGKEEEMIVSQSSFGQAWVKVYRVNMQILGDFLAYPGSHKGGVNVACGDIDGDGKDEIITGAGAGGGPQVRAFEFTGQPTALNFFAYHPDFRGGVNVACGNIEQKSAKRVVTFPGRLIYEGRRDLYKYIEIDISEQKLKAYMDGKKVAEFLVSSGIWKYPTPIGDFKIWTKMLSDRMKWEYGPNHPDNYDLPNVPHVMYFSGAYALHGAYWHRNFGHRMSHGCVNLSLPDAAWLYQWANVGDIVLVRP